MSVRATGHAAVAGSSVTREMPMRYVKNSPICKMQNRPRFLSNSAPLCKIKIIPPTATNPQIF